jgi:cytochrome c peroxidase
MTYAKPVASTKKKFLQPRMATLLLAISFLGAWFPGASAFGVTVIPPPTQLPLNQIAVPEPPNLFQFVKNKPAAIRLGKALYWDMQAGSDGIQACGTCHFSAGVDKRLKNTVHPGFDNNFSVRRPNETLLPSDFPFLERQDPDTQSQILRDSDDIVGSQGVRFTDFVNIVAGSAVDIGNPVPDPVFHANGNNMRRVTNRQAPSVINAVFNFSNFWDGRAHFEFNGVNPFGTLDPSAGVWFNINGTLVRQPIAIQFGSLASQATGPPLNETEMSYRGRTFPQLGRKMLSLTPLGKQLVHPFDSELGALSRAVQQPDGSMTGAKGLKSNYAQMIKDAFQDKFWNSNQLTADGFTQMEANFSLFWGLAIQLYEATLVSDQSPFDQFLGEDPTALTDQQKNGFTLFFGIAGCSGCHAGPETTSASVAASAFLTNTSHALIEPMPVVSGAQVIYDAGFNNTAVRPTAEDICRGADSPMINFLTGQPFPLSFSALAELQAVGNLGFNGSLFPLGSPRTPILPPNIPANFTVANNGSFKVPSLRNIELTAPYFHNGGVMTLQDVVEFYVRGADFRLQNQDNVDVLIAGIPSLVHNPTGQAALVAFLQSFTDERVRNESAPFDHPEILIPNGDPEVLIRIPAKDENGTAAPSLPTVTLNPVTSPTALTSQVISGSKESGALVRVAVNGGASLPADTSGDTTWSTAVTGLVAGSNAISISATDVAGGVTNLGATIVASISGGIVINGGAASTTSQSVTLTLSASTVAGSITQMQFSKDGGISYTSLEPFASTRVANLLPGFGPKTMTVRFKDSSGTLSAPFTASINLVPATITGSVIINGGAAVTTSQSATLALSATGTNPVTQMQFSKDGGVSYTPMEPYAGTRVVTLLPGFGPKTMTVRFGDGVGNLSAPVTAGINLVPVAGTVVINGGATTTGALSATLTLAATCNSGTVTQMQFSKDGGVTYTGLEPYATARVVTLLPGNGLKTMTVRYKDSLGNLSAPVSSSITLSDTTKPTGTITFSSPNPTTAATGILALTASDLNGVPLMQFSKNGIDYFAWEPFSVSRTVSLALGLNTLTVRFQDALGNVSDPISATVTRQ